MAAYVDKVVAEARELLNQATQSQSGATQG